MHHKLEIFANVEKVIMIAFLKRKEDYYIPFVGKITNIPKLKYNITHHYPKIEKFLDINLTKYIHDSYAGNCIILI